jgi:hypothetical protein
MECDHLTHSNYLIYAAKHYLVDQYHTTDDFIDDLKRIKYIKKLLTRYIENGDLKERLILNHIIVLNNCFGPEALCKILYLKFKSQMRYIKPFLVMLSILQDEIRNVDGDHLILSDEFDMDNVIVEKLRNL